MKNWCFYNIVVDNLANHKNGLRVSACNRARRDLPNKYLNQLKSWFVELFDFIKLYDVELYEEVYRLYNPRDYSAVDLLLIQTRLGNFCRNFSLQRIDENFKFPEIYLFVNDVFEQQKAESILKLLNWTNDLSLYIYSISEGFIDESICLNEEQISDLSVKIVALKKEILNNIFNNQKNEYFLAHILEDIFNFSDNALSADFNLISKVHSNNTDSDCKRLSDNFEFPRNHILGVLVSNVVSCWNDISSLRNEPEEMDC